ncbi:hypothetical protein OBBRIDRAFT_741197, partial [Obba rivulosa]
CWWCLRWGHAGVSCYSNHVICACCGSAHIQLEHNMCIVCCRANPDGRVNSKCPHLPICVNCAGLHSALKHVCLFWRHCFDATSY